MQAVYKNFYAFPSFTFKFIINYINIEKWIQRCEEQIMWKDEKFCFKLLTAI